MRTNVSLLSITSNNLTIFKRFKAFIQWTPQWESLEVRGALLMYDFDSHLCPSWNVLAQPHLGEAFLDSGVRSPKRGSSSAEVAAKYTDSVN